MPFMVNAPNLGGGFRVLRQTQQCAPTDDRPAENVEALGGGGRGRSPDRPLVRRRAAAMSFGRAAPKICVRYCALWLTLVCGSAMRLIGVVGPKDGGKMGHWIMTRASAIAYSCP